MNLLLRIAALVVAIFCAAIFAAVLILALPLVTMIFMAILYVAGIAGIGFGLYWLFCTALGVRAFPLG